MDPTRGPMPSVSLALITLCGKVLQGIADYVRNVQNVDRRIEELNLEVETLKSALQRICRKEKENRSEEIATRPSTGMPEPLNQSEYWKKLHDALGHCRSALLKLEKLLQEIGRGGIPILRRANLQHRLSNKLQDIDGLRVQIAAYRKSVQLALEIMIMSSQVRTEAMTKTRFEELGKDVKDLHSMLAEIKEALSQIAPNAMPTLEAFASSADEVVRQASEYYSARSRSHRSENGDPNPFINGERIDRTRSWVQQNSTTHDDIHDENDSDAPVASASYTARTSATNEYQNPFITRAFKMANQAYKAGNYTRAKDALCNLVQEVERRESRGITYYERNNMFPLLVWTYCRLEEWKNAEETLGKIPTEGRARCIHTLLGCYFERQMWNDALDVLKQPNFPTTEVSEQTEWWKELLVAEIYMEKGEFDNAIAAGLRAQEDMERILGQDHIRYRMATDLLASIYERQGEQIKADILRLDEPVEELKVCRILEILHRSWPEDVAAIVERTLSPYVKFNVSWEEIEANIREGNVIGSGRGYTLLHTFVEEGSIFAADFLLELGIDVNAKTKQRGITALHLAVQRKQEALVRLLLRHNADPYADDAKNVTVWNLAAQPGFESILRIVADSVYHTKVTEGEANGQALMGAIHRDDEQMCDFLLSLGVPTDIRDGNGATPLHKAIEKRNLKIAELLRKRGANFDAYTKQGVTILMTAVATQDVELVKFVLNTSRASLEARNGSGETALSMAAKLGLTDVVQSLISSDAECTKEYPMGQTPQEVATRFEIVEILHKARMRKRSWLKCISRDELEDHYEEAKIVYLSGGNPPQRHPNFKYHRNGGG